MSQNMSQSTMTASLSQWFRPVFSFYANAVYRSYLSYPFESVALILHYQCHLLLMHSFMYSKTTLPSPDSSFEGESEFPQVLHPQGVVWDCDGSWSSNLCAGTVSSVREIKIKVDDRVLENLPHNTKQKRRN